MLIRIVEWFWGHNLGPSPFIRSWDPGVDTHKPPRYCGWMLIKFALQNWGIAWPTLGDRILGGTSQPIWNWIWLRSRLGFPLNNGPEL